MRVAAVDCGTNSLRLLVADVDSRGGRAADVERRTTIVRLGQDVDRTGVFASEALERTFAALDTYAEVIHGLDVAATRFVATSAARDVANGDALVAGVRDRLGVDPDIVSGDEEARLSYDGATRGLAEVPGVEEPVLVVDIGGGSTEFVLRVAQDGQAGRVRGQSLDIGAVRMTERHLHSDPPTADEVAALEHDVDQELDTLDVRLTSAGTLVGVAGTITTLAAAALRLSTYDRDAIHRARIPSSDLLAAIDAIVAMTVDERRALGFMAAGRADVIGAGALTLGRVIRRSGARELVASEHDILDGIAWSLVGKGRS
jgi:exopolyphosphatase/guanosine-5'-triphosphate,3'-diphosphate pyrophosphatase